MLYLKMYDGKLHVIVLESANLDALKNGLSAKTPDGTIQIFWSPDGSGTAVATVIQESLKRPEKTGSAITGPPTVWSCGGPA